ncbi:sulfotransferase family 2 domain-containing protein [Microbacterium sp. KR10-403]|uniref:sulfotransferase family 2 domain-containing protein n=1 Tax=Microbacterium sp. KR10-403 TaxID=3158581 RepID=UPI0032E3F8B1
MPVFRKNGKNILFIHVPKCGGSSVEYSFRDSGYRVEYRDPKLGRKSLNHLRTCSPQHMHAEMLRQTLRVERFELVFMIVREPIARFRSEYVYLHRKHEAVSRKAADVSAWARKEFRAYEKDPFVLDNHLRPQSEFWMPEAVVYRLEDGFDAMLDDLNTRFHVGVTAAERALHSEKEVGFPSSEVELSDDLTQHLRGFYHDDFERFGYEPGVKPAASKVPLANGDRFHRTVNRLERRTRSVVRRIRP